MLNHACAITEAEYGALAARISRLAPNAQLFRCAHEPVCFRNVESGEESDLTWATGRKIAAFCGIGRPEAFIEMLEALGASVEANIIFDDHYRLTERDITRIIDAARGVEAIVTTEKDIARLGERIALPNLHALVIRLEIEDSSRLADKING